MANQKKVLILTADAGFGHRSAANAIVEALRERYGDQCRVEIENPLDDKRIPAFLRDSQSDYDRLVREMPEVYKLRYQLSDAPIPTTLLESAVTVILFKVIQELLVQHQPDVIVTTYPLYPAPLRAIIATSKVNTPFFTVVTDLGQVHRMWFNPGTELCLVPTQAVRQLALENGLADEKIQITGIPVNPKLAQPKDEKSVLRARLGWRTDLATVLVVGSKRVKNLEGVLHVLNHSGLPVQLVVATGGDDELYHKLKEIEWHGLAHIYNYVKDMPTYMLASDMIICKAGGLIVTESLAAGLPLLLVDVTPGQEEGNAEYVLKNGAGELAETPLDAMVILCHWLAHDQALLKERAAKAQATGQPQAAYTIADLVWGTAERGPQPFSESTLNIVPWLGELLHRSGLTGESTTEETIQA